LCKDISLSPILVGAALPKNKACRYPGFTLKYYISLIESDEEKRNCYNQEEEDYRLEEDDDQGPML
jgi:hypothetical protein